MTMTQTNHDKVHDCMARSSDHGEDVQGHDHLNRHHRDAIKRKSKRRQPEQTSRHRSRQEDHRQRKRKEVCFDATDNVREIPHLNEMSDDEVRSVYMSSDELKAVQQECRSLVKILTEREESDGDSASSSVLSVMYDSDNGHNKYDDDDDAMCFRGLEEHTPKRTAMARKIRNGIYNSVYTMQCFHSNSSTSSAAESFPSSDYGGMLATVCRRLSAISAQHAYIAGKSDELAAIKISKEARRMLRKKQRADRRSRPHRDRQECDPERLVGRSQSFPVASSNTSSSRRHGRHSRRSRRHAADDRDNVIGDDDDEDHRRHRSSTDRHHRNDHHHDDHHGRHGHTTMTMTAATTTTKKKNHKKDKKHSHSRLVMVPKQHKPNPEMVVPTEAVAAAPDPFRQRQPPPPPPDPGKEEPHVPMLDGIHRRDGATQLVDQALRVTSRWEP